MARTPGFGVDIGGSGIKGCTVDLRSGSLEEQRVRVPTPAPATPTAVAELVATITDDFGWHGPMGVTLPSVLKRGIALTAAHLDPAWKGLAADKLFSEYCRVPVVVLNDADAAGLAEMRFGAGRDHDGVVLLLTCRSMASRPRPEPPLQPGMTRRCRGRTGPPGCRATCRYWKIWCGRI
jgi:polyphosphate glucokinase